MVSVHLVQCTYNEEFYILSHFLNEYKKQISIIFPVQKPGCDYVKRDMTFNFIGVLLTFIHDFLTAQIL